MNSLALTNFGPIATPVLPDRAVSDRIARNLANALAAISELVDGAGIILNPLPIRRADAAPMEIPSQNLSSLLNTVLAQSNLKQIPADLLGKPQVIEATVLSNSPLLQTGAQAGEQTGANYRVTVQWQGRTLQLLSAQLLQIGARVQLQINAQGELTLLSGATAAPAPTILPGSFSKPMLALQMALRENLSQAEPLQSLLPLLLKLSANTEQLPQALGRAIAQLLQNLPTPEQLRNPAALKQALTNSGTLLEARLAQADPAATANIVANDFKAQIVQLLALLRGQGYAAPAPARAPLANDNGDADLVYSARPAHGAAAQAAKSDSAETTETLLNQLGKLLTGALARVQINQLDGAAARHLAGPDNPQPVPTWVFELPVHTQRGAEHLQVRIEQRQEQQREGRPRSQWTVNIGFDLHELGKLAATLTIVERSVAATLWSEREHMHQAVRREVDHLRAGLEQVGVKVTEVQCRLGLPPQRNAPLSQQLVDVLT